MPTSSKEMKDPLVCTEEIAKALCYEATFGGKCAQNPQVLVLAGALWQRNRILEYLKEQVTTMTEDQNRVREAQKKKMESGSEFSLACDGAALVSYISGGRNEKLIAFMTLIQELERYSFKDHQR